MVARGEDIIEVGLSRKGQQYVFGADVPLDNAGWKGPWDCAEFASWCAFQAYGLVFGAGNPKKVAAAEPYSGHWFDEAKASGRLISPKEALKIEGAVLIRAPTKRRIGHVAFSMGNGRDTLEARGKAFGVGVFDSSSGRGWSIGCLLPGVDYGTVTAGPAAPEEERFPDGFLWLTDPMIKGPAVVTVQKALDAKGIDPGGIDGEFGPKTSAAVVSFQAREGLEVDGVVGPATAGALGLAFPIVPKPADQQTFADAVTPPEPDAVTITGPAAAGTDPVVDIFKTGKLFKARTASGFVFAIGSSTTFTDDMTRVGLFQGSTSINDSIKNFGVYDADDFAGQFDGWEFFIEPTLLAEGGGRFATLNSYDRAAFTFGAPQLAAHTPNANFVVYLRELLRQTDAPKYFPELSLRPDAAGKDRVHLAKSGGFVNLEDVVLVTRPNGKKENQLAKLMAYLNSSPTAVDEAELSAAARLMNLLRLDPRAKALQIAVFIAEAQKKLDQAKVRVEGFDRKDWRTCLWIMDILHQGRGSFDQMSAAMKQAKPEVALMKIGLPKYETRIDTVAAAVKTLAASGRMDGFEI